MAIHSFIRRAETEKKQVNLLNRSSSSSSLSIMNCFVYTNIMSTCMRIQGERKKASNDQGSIYRLILLPYCRTQVSKIVLGFVFFLDNLHCLDRRQRNVIVGFDLIKLGRLMQLIRSTSATYAYLWSSGCNSHFLRRNAEKTKTEKIRWEVWCRIVKCIDRMCVESERWHEV